MIVTCIILKQVMGWIGRHNGANMQWLAAYVVDDGVKLKKPPPTTVTYTLFQ